MKHALAAFAFATALLSSPGQTDEIVVRGQTLSKEEAKARAIAFLQAVGVASSVRPAARWQDPVCPKVIGIVDPKVAGEITARIRSIAAQAGARLAKSGCTGNLILAFADDGAELARQMTAANPRLMGQVSAEWRNEVTQGTEAIRWWYSSEVRNADGRPPLAATLPWYSVELDGGNNAIAANVDVGNESGGGFNVGNRSSLVSTNAKRAITEATVVVDVSRANGKDLDAVTDYAALVGLAEIRFVPTPVPDTILAMFQPENSVTALTSQDLALLKSLYRLPLDRQGRYHRGWLIRDIGAALAVQQ